VAIRIPTWTGRALLAVAGALLLLWVAAGWMHANAIRAELMIPSDHRSPFDLLVVTNEAGRVVVNRTDESAREGVWGLEGAAAYAQVATIVRVTETTVERGVRALDGVLEPADEARIDHDAFTGDPEFAHGIGWEAARTPSDIGPHPAWFVDGRRSTWILFAHGEGNDRLGESLRIIPALVEQGFPVLSITYRNDIGATPNDSGLRYWGLEEWRDLDAAVELGLRKGAKDFVIIGSGLGAEVVSMFLHESDRVGAVRSVIYDSPVLDLESVARQYASDEGTPWFVSWLGRRLVSVRFGMDWGDLDQQARVAEFDVPILLLYGADDPVTSTGDFEAFSDAIPHLVVPERFEQGRHADLWNIDSARYESAIAEFLLQTVGPE
jgi:pimeloyl-ACP methyl ester carboxylesterase